MPRISLDVTPGTFTKVDETCRQNHQKKSDYLRELIDERFKNGRDKEHTVLQ